MSEVDFGCPMLSRLTKERPRFNDELDTVKFICTDLWSTIYKKQIDNLRTNHQGVYVLHDCAFRFLAKLSTGRQYLESAPKVSVTPFPCLHKKESERSIQTEYY